MDTNRVGYKDLKIDSNDLETGRGDFFVHANSSL
jgi:hypothetical protein